MHTNAFNRHAGQVGYIICGMKSASEAHIGDTFHHLKSKVEPLPGFEAAKSMVSVTCNDSKSYGRQENRTRIITSFLYRCLLAFFQLTLPIFRN